MQVLQQHSTDEFKCLDNSSAPIVKRPPALCYLNGGLTVLAEDTEHFCSKKTVLR